MSARTPYIVGKGTKVYIALLPLGDDSAPTPFTATTSGTVAKAANSITLSAALGANVLVPAKSYLNLKHPTTGLEYLVQLSADAEAGDSSLAIEDAPEDIPTGCTIEYPLRLRYRSNADLNRQANRETAVDFESDGYERGLTTSISQGMSCNGFWSPQDAGYATAEEAFNELRYCYCILEMPKPRQTYTKGRQYKGIVTITSAPLNIPAGGIINANLELSWEGKPEIIPAA